MTISTDADHGITIEQVQLPAGTPFRAACLCGWISGTIPSRPGAVVAGQVHESKASREHARQLRETIDARRMDVGTGDDAAAATRRAHIRSREALMTANATLHEYTDQWGGRLSQLCLTDDGESAELSLRLWPDNEQTMPQHVSESHARALIAALGAGLEALAVAMPDRCTRCGDHCRPVGDDGLCWQCEAHEQRRRPRLRVVDPTATPKEEGRDA